MGQMEGRSSMLLSMNLAVRGTDLMVPTASTRVEVSFLQ